MFTAEWLEDLEAGLRGDADIMRERYGLTGSPVRVNLDDAADVVSALRTARRRGAHSVERINPPNATVRGYTVYAGDLGHQIGTYQTKAEAKDALDTWHYFNPEEQRARDEAWVHEFVQSIRGALELGPEAVEATLSRYESRYLRDEAAS